MVKQKNQPVSSPNEPKQVQVNQGNVAMLTVTLLNEINNNLIKLIKIAKGDE